MAQAIVVIDGAKFNLYELGDTVDIINDGVSPGLKITADNGFGILNLPGNAQDYTYMKEAGYNVAGQRVKKRRSGLPVNVLNRLVIRKIDTRQLVDVEPGKMVLKDGVL